jgi:hypothetical protein
MAERQLFLIPEWTALMDLISMNRGNGLTEDFLAHDQALRGTLWSPQGTHPSLSPNMVKIADQSFADHIISRATQR